MMNSQNCHTDKSYAWLHYVVCTVNVLLLCRHRHSTSIRISVFFLSYFRLILSRKYRITCRKFCRYLILLSRKYQSHLLLTKLKLSTTFICWMALIISCKQNTFLHYRKNDVSLLNCVISEYDQAPGCNKCASWVLLNMQHNMLAKHIMLLVEKYSWGM